MLYRTFVAGGSTMVVPARFVFLCVLCAFRGESFSGFNTEDTEKGHRGPRRIKKTDKNSCHACALACVVGSRVIHGKGRVLGGSRLMADAIVLIDDLFCQAKLLETAKQTGTTVETVATGDQLLKAAAANPAALIIVDLNARQGA